VGATDGVDEVVGGGLAVVVVGGHMPGWSSAIRFRVVPMR
jgi:hypothetical protein